MIITLKELVDPTEGTHQQGDLPPIQEDLEGDMRDFQFSDKE